MTITTLKLDGRLGSEAAAKLEAESTERAGARSQNADGDIINLQDLAYISSQDSRMLVLAMEQFRKRGAEFASVRPSLMSTIDGN